MTDEYSVYARFRSMAYIFILTSFVLNGSYAGVINAPQDSLGQTLYNGIRLPDSWPPRDGDPYLSELMPVPYLENPPEIIPIDVGRQLFVDDFLIEETNLRRVFHQAKKYEENPVVANGALRNGGVFYDPVEKHFKMMYNAKGSDVSMAYSKDLRHWIWYADPQDAEGSAVPKGGANSFWLRADDSSHRKFFFMRRTGRVHPRPKNDPNVPFVNVIWKYTLNTSSDGKSWSEADLLGRSNDYSSFFYNPFRDVWVYSLKHNVPRVGREVYRTRYYLEQKSTPKVDNFDDAVFWVNADQLDEPHPKAGDAAQLYSLQGVAYESLLLGAFQVHLGPKNEISEAQNEPKFTEIKLGFSRDGFHWHRPDRTAFIKGTYQDGDWDKAFINVPQGICLVMGDELWFPYCAYSGVAANGKKGMYNGAGIGMATLRRDGFASMEAEKQTGTLLTRPVLFKGQYLFVNVDCPNGELQVEVLNEHNQVIEGFSAALCRPIRVDKTLHKVEWKTGEGLSDLANKPVKFRFHLTNGKLYSFWVSPNESGASYGYVGAGGPGYDGMKDTRGSIAF